MKILLLVKDINVYGGAEKVAVNLANFLSLENEVEILSLIGNKNRNHHEILKNIKTSFLNRNSSDIKVKNKMIRFFLNFIKLKFEILINSVFINRYIKNKKYDLIISNNVIGYNAKLINKKSKVIAIQHMCYEEIDKELLNLKYIGKIHTFFWRLRIKFRNKQYKKMDGLVVLTHRDKILFQNIALKNIEVIFNAITKNDSSISLVENKKIIAVGRLSREKGFDRLINIVKDIFKEFPDWILEIYGDGDDKNKILEMIKEYSLQNNVYIYSPLKDIKNKMMNASIMTVTSRQEGFPMVILEAFSLGLPVITYEYSSSQSIIKNGVDGIIVGYNNEEEFIEKLKYLIKNQEIRRQISLEAKKKAEDFLWEKIGNEWKVYIEKITEFKRIDE